MTASNPYSSGTQKVIPAVLLYAYYGEKILMVKKINWNGLGGKLELNETTGSAAVREFFEESDCQTKSSDWIWLGQILFPNFKADKHEDWFVTIYYAHLSTEQFQHLRTLDESHSEGQLSFFTPEEILKLELWDGDRHFLPLVFQKTPFQGTFYYQNGKYSHHELKLIQDLSPTI